VLHNTCIDPEKVISVERKKFKTDTVSCSFKTFLTLSRPAEIGNSRAKTTGLHVALCGNLSGSVSATDPVKEGCGFFVSDIISGGLLSHLGPLHLALGANR